MIKFFRKIRQKLLTENKFNKYLIYAIGEIFLVVIGILIALQINTWNNEQTRKKAEIAAVKQLKADLTKSRAGLEGLIEFMEESARASAKVCHAFWKNDTPQDSIYRYMRRPLATKVFSPTIGTARSLIVSGNMGLIKSDVLKNEITSYVEEVDYILKDINRYEESYFRTGMEMISEHVTFSSLAPQAYYIKRIEEGNDPDFGNKMNDEFLEIPNVIEKVLFEADLNELFQNQEVYKGYSYLLVAHRNSVSRYKEILDITIDLLAEVDRIFGSSLLADD